MKKNTPSSSTPYALLGISQLFSICSKPKITAKDIETIKQLIRGRADVNVTDELKGTPMSVAAGNGHLEIVELLIENKANVNIRHWSLGTPIFQAAMNGHLEIVKLLIENNAKVDAATENDCTPLFVAAEKGHLEIVKLLIENNANVNVTNRSGITAGFTALHMAVINGHLEIVKVLIENKANVNTTTIKKNTALHIAAANNRLTIAKLLIENGAKFNMENDRKETFFDYITEPPEQTTSANSQEDKLLLAEYEFLKLIVNSNKEFENSILQIVNHYGKANVAAKTNSDSHHVKKEEAAKSNSDFHIWLVVKEEKIPTGLLNSLFGSLVEKEHKNIIRTIIELRDSFKKTNQVYGDFENQYKAKKPFFKTEIPDLLALNREKNNLFCHPELSEGPVSISNSQK